MKEVELFGDERIEPLDETHAIIQSVSGYRFGSDAVKLAHYAAELVKKDSRVIELCSGCGIISIELAVKSGCGAVGVEIDPELYGMSVRSAELNGLEGLRFINADIRVDLPLENNSYDFVLCNPPFFKADSRSRKVAPAANSELTVTLKDVITVAKRLLKQGGALVMVYTCSRLDELLAECRAIGLMPKALVVNNSGKTFILKAVLGGKSGLTVTTDNW